MNTGTRSRKSPIKAVSQIPAFASEDAERDWWAAHDLAEELYDALEPPAAELRRVLGRRDARNGVIRLVIEGPPPVYGAALSLLSPKHPHAGRVAELRAKAEKIMKGRRPLQKPLAMVVSQVYTDQAMADAANIIGAVSNALEGIIYENDRLIREAYFRSRRGARSSYTVLVRALK